MIWCIISSEDGGGTWYLQRDWLSRDAALADYASIQAELPLEKHELHSIPIALFYALAMPDGTAIPAHLMSSSI